MAYNLLNGKKGIIFGALNDMSIAWKVAEKAHEEGAQFVLTNTPMALRLGDTDQLAEATGSIVIPADATSIPDLENLFIKTLDHFDGKDLYPSIEEKAANLLYLVTKNHSFVDGNKRIAAYLFLLFLEKNNLLFTDTGDKRIPDNALVALTLMIAVSNTDEKDTMTKVIVNLINKNNAT